MHSGCICSFTHTFEKNDQFAKEMVKPENIEGYIHLALKEARILYNEEAGFIEPAKSEPLYKEYEEMNDPFGGWLDEIDVEVDVIGGINTEVYGRYKDYTVSYGYCTMSKENFSKKLCKALNLAVKQKWMDGKNRKVYASTK